MELSRTLWSIVRHCFETDDGSLPGIGLEDLEPDQLAQVYDLLRSIGGTPTRGDSLPCLWDHRINQEVPLDSVSNPIPLIAEGIAGPIHFLLPSVFFDSTTLPDLGVYISSNSIILDYRMGASWSSTTVLCFFKLLRALHDIAPNSRICFDSAFLDPDAFLKA